MEGGGQGCIRRKGTSEAAPEAPMPTPPPPRPIPHGTSCLVGCYAGGSSATAVGEHTAVGQPPTAIDGPAVERPQAPEAIFFWFF